MPPLDPAATRDTAAHLHVKAPDDRPDHREVFLILRRDAGQLHRAPTAGARRRQRRVIRHIDMRGNRAPGAAPIPATGPSSPWPAAALRAIFGERGRLPEPGAPRGIELLLQAFTPALPSIAVALRPRQVVAQAPEFFLLVPDQLVAFVVGWTRALIGHARFMADSRKKYKYEFVTSAMSPAK